MGATVKTTCLLSLLLMIIKRCNYKKRSMTTKMKKKKTKMKKKVWEFLVLLVIIIIDVSRIIILSVDVWPCITMWLCGRMTPWFCVQAPTPWTHHFIRSNSHILGVSHVLNLRQHESDKLLNSMHLDSTIAEFKTTRVWQVVSPNTLGFNHGWAQDNVSLTSF